VEVRQPADGQTQPLPHSRNQIGAAKRWKNARTSLVMPIPHIVERLNKAVGDGGGLNNYGFANSVFSVFGSFARHSAALSGFSHSS